MKAEEENAVYYRLSNVAFNIAYDDYQESDWGYDGHDERIVTYTNNSKLQNAIIAALKAARNEALEEAAAMAEPSNAKLARGIRSRKMTEV